MPSRTIKQAGTTLPLSEVEDSESQLIEGYRALIERIPGIVYAAGLGEAGEWLYVSNQVESILGWSVDEWRADALMWYRRLHPDDRARALADEQRCRSTGQPLNSEYRMIARDGRVIWFQDRASLVNDESGNPAFLQGVMLDITDLKAVEADLRDSKARLAKAQHIARMGSWEWDIQSSQLRMSEGFYDICGIEPQSFPRTLDAGLQLVHPEDREGVRAVVEAARESPAPISRQLRLLRSERDTRLLEVHAEVEAENGRPVRMMGTVRDVTDHKEVEEALRRKHDQFQSIIDNSPSIIYAKDRGYRYLFVNRAFGRRYQVEPDSMVGRRDETIIPLDVAGRARESDRRVLETGEDLQEEQVVWRWGDKRTYLTQKFPLRDSAGQIYAVCAISTDITERKAREEELRAEVDWSIRVRDAIRDDRLVLHSQPILDLRTNEIHQEELLVRMRDGGGLDELIMPGEFLPAAERFGLVQEIDRWVVGEAVKLARHRRVEVNLSGRSIGDAALIELIESQLRSHGPNPENLVFEITETAAAENIDAARDLAWRLRALGCGFALDDFGTGYGSFTYLKHLPVTFIKIDLEFVRYLALDPSDEKIVRSIIAVAQNFGVQTIAEGVEHATTLELLRELGVDYAQGYLIGEPRPVKPPPPGR